ncbi:MAG: SCO family protein [Myxococcales bacterium]|nr:SCO family protein [Myxococcales bacterium]
MLRRMEQVPTLRPSASVPAQAAAPRRISGRLAFVILALLVVVLFSIIAGGSLLAKRGALNLPTLGQMPAFAFVDEAGVPVTEREVVGNVIIANFIFTRCDTICPVSSALMAKLQLDTKDVADGVKLLSFSVDPAYDTPARLAAYAKRYAANPGRWRFLTGDFAQIRSVMEDGLKLALEHNGSEPGAGEGAVPNINHSGHFVLLDRSLAIRGYYDSRDPGRMQALSHHARYLARSGTGRQ